MRKYLFTLSIAALAATASADTVDTAAAGSLGDMITNKDITELTASGEINALDIAFVNDSLASLKSLDLSAAKIMPVTTDKAQYEAMHTYEANVLPYASFFGKPLESLVLPATLTAIEEAAVAGCDKLTSITLPASLTTIGNYAFRGCESLTSLIVPSTVTTLGEGVFANCSGIKTLEVNSSEIPTETFACCSAITSVTIGDNVSSIGDGAFRGCTSDFVVTVISNNSLTDISADAFTQSGLKSVNFTDCTNLQNIGEFAFANTKISALTLPDNISTMGDGAFFNLSTLTEITLPAIDEVPAYAFADSNATSIKLGAGTKSIGAHALRNMDQVEDLVIPATVEYIGDEALENMTGLTLIYTERNVPATLGVNVFAGIDQPTVELHVPKAAVDTYKITEQWKKFKIEDLSFLETNSLGRDDVNAFFSGSTLYVKSTTNITNFKMYDVNGILLVEKAPNSNMFETDTTDFSGNIYIVTVATEKGNAVFKLAR